MRKVIDLGYGSKESVTFKGDKRKRVTLKRTVNGELSIIIEHAVKSIIYGYDVISTHISSPIGHLN